MYNSKREIKNKSKIIDFLNYDCDMEYDIDYNVNMKLNPLLNTNNNDAKSNNEIIYNSVKYQLSNSKKNPLLLVKGEHGNIFYLSPNESLKLGDEMKKTSWSIAWDHIIDHLYKFGKTKNKNKNKSDIPKYMILTEYQFNYINKIRLEMNVEDEC